MQSDRLLKELERVLRELETTTDQADRKKLLRQMRQLIDEADGILLDGAAQSL